MTKLNTYRVTITGDEVICKANTIGEAAEYAQSFHGEPIAVEQIDNGYQAPSRTWTLQYSANAEATELATMITRAIAQDTERLEAFDDTGHDEAIATSRELAVEHLEHALDHLQLGIPEEES